MRAVNVPLRHSRGLVAIAAQVDVGCNLAHRSLEIQIRRCGVNRVTVEDHEHIDLAGVHITDELADAAHLIRRNKLDWIGVDNRLPDIAQGLVDLCRENV